MLGVRDSDVKRVLQVSGSRTRMSVSPLLRPLGTEVWPLRSPFWVRKDLILLRVFVRLSWS